MTIGYIHLRPGQYYLTERAAEEAKQHLEEILADPGRSEGSKEFWKNVYEEDNQVGLHGTPDASGGMTIAYELSGISDPHVVYAVSRCSDRDNFNKRIGRVVATGRLARVGKCACIPYDPAVSLPEQVVRDVMRRSDNGEL
jgi:hypothetical protein